jgi:ABC-type nitrate/sulfonate/bicarbonate transport system permease component
MTSKKISPKNISYYVLSLFIIWIILFEFILPSNNFLPKPSVVMESFGSLWKDYHLFRNSISSIAAVYISIIAAYYLLKVLNKFSIIGEKGFYTFIFLFEWFSKYVPGIILGFFLIYWFPGSEYTKYIFIFLVVFNSLFIKYFNLLPNVNRAYVDSAISLGARKSFIAGKVIWKSFEPDLIKSICSSHLYFWILIISFEFANYGNGLGSIFRRTLEFKDLSGLLAAAFTTGVFIWLGSIILNFIEKKFFFWSTFE